MRIGFGTLLEVGLGAALGCLFGVFEGGLVGFGVGAGLHALGLVGSYSNSVDWPAISGAIVGGIAGLAYVVFSSAKERTSEGSV
jgi:hypothetical protein